MRGGGLRCIRAGNRLELCAAAKQPRAAVGYVSSFIETLQSMLTVGALIGHLSYFLLVLSMLMTSLTWLRIVAIGSGIASFVFDYFFIDNTVGAFWDVLFVCANMFQLLMTAFRDRVARFSDEERLFCQYAVPTLPPSSARMLLTRGSWHDGAPGNVLTTQGEMVPALVFLTAGELEVLVDGHAVARVGPPHFIGEMSIALNEPAIATVVARSEIRYLGFSREALRRLYRRNPDIRQALEASFNRGLRQKLSQSNEEKRARSADRAKPQRRGRKSANKPARQRSD